VSPQQLTAEVMGIYAGLVMVEAKCAKVDTKQAAATFDDDSQAQQPRLNGEQGRALHRFASHPTV